MSLFTASPDSGESLNRNSGFCLCSVFVLIFSWVYRLIWTLVVVGCWPRHSRASYKPLEGGSDCRALFCLVLFSYLVWIAGCFAFIDVQAVLCWFFAGEILPSHSVNLTDWPSAGQSDSLCCGYDKLEPFRVSRGWHWRALAVECDCVVHFHMFCVLWLIAIQPIFNKLPMI